MTKPATARDGSATPAAAPSAGSVPASTTVAATTAAAATPAANARPRLQEALLANQRRVFENLLRDGAKPDETGADGLSVVHLAARHEDSWWLETLLSKGADPNVRHTRSGARPIMDAVQTHRDKNIDLLLRAGVDLNATNNAGDTALHVAAATNRAAYSLKFLKSGANPKALDGMGRTFQAYQFMPPDERLAPDIRRDRDAIRAWLREHKIAVER